jgi:predicted pyridoxine 5'-phosphate oxidase superfamily flavin-nucleotide-binding protein
VYGLQNILINPRVGVIFMLPGTPETVRVNGRATLTSDPELLARLAARGKPAVLAIRVRVEECFHHCAKAFLRSKLWKPETWQERMKISFGKMAAKRMKLGDEVAARFDAAVEDDYRNNL